MIKKAILAQFPNAISVESLVVSSQKVLFELGYTKENTIFAGSLCRDEINRRAAKLFADVWGENFQLGGLAGFPSSGKTGMFAYSDHVPTGGRQLIVYGPHIAISKDGKWGVAERKEMDQTTTACGSLFGAIEVLQKRSYVGSLDPLDVEQSLVVQNLFAKLKDTQNMNTSILEITAVMVAIIGRALDQLLAIRKHPHPYAMIGGILINTSVNESDYFVPHKFVTVSQENNLVEEINHIGRLGES